MLRIENLAAGYGAAQVLHGVSIEVERGEVVALLGPNGAGKSTLMGCVLGLLKPTAGNILVEGQSVRAEPTYKIIQRGVALVPEGRRIFGPFTVRDNLRMGSLRLSEVNGHRFADQLDYVYSLFPRLKERAGQQAGTLSGGEQQMLSIGRSLMSNPRLLLLDEPFLGLAPKIVDEIRTAIETLRSTGLTLLLVEQKLDIALGIASRAYVLIKGRLELSASSGELLARSDLSDLYFSLSSKSDGVSHGN